MVRACLIALTIAGSRLRHSFVFEDCVEQALGACSTQYTQFSRCQPRKVFLVFCGKCAKRICHKTQEIRRVLQTRASARYENQTDSRRIVEHR